jgi:2-aminomuconate deaminase
MTMTSTSDIVYSPRAPEALGPYPHARRVGDLLFVSGIGPRRRGEKSVPGNELDADGRVVRYDIEAQCRSVFDNVRVILEDAGSSWDRLVDVTVFLLDLERDWVPYNRLYEEYFAAVKPCRTTVGVARLPGPIAIELKCIASLKQ